MSGFDCFAIQAERQSLSKGWNVRCDLPDRIAVHNAGRHRDFIPGRSQPLRIQEQPRVAYRPSYRYVMLLDIARSPTRDHKSSCRSIFKTQEKSTCNASFTPRLELAFDEVQQHILKPNRHLAAHPFSETTFRAAAAEFRALDPIRNNLSMNLHDGHLVIYHKVTAVQGMNENTGAPIERD